jgi:hypothetical protein
MSPKKYVQMKIDEKQARLEENLKRLRKRLLRNEPGLLSISSHNQTGGELSNEY